MWRTLFWNSWSLPASSVQLKGFWILSKTDFERNQDNLQKKLPYLMKSTTISAGIRSISEAIKCGNIRNAIVLTGAGLSVAAGIPDFRSPGGLYDTLRPELITATESQRALLRSNPTAVVDIRLFSQNQFPYLEVRRPFILGTAEKQWKPTLGHFFIRVLSDKGILRRLYSQNIDGLDGHAGIPDEQLVNVHGTIGRASCEFCGNEYAYDEFCSAVRANIRNIYDPSDAEAPSESRNIQCKKCRRPGVKPSAVLYGSNLPGRFFDSVENDFQRGSFFFMNPFGPLGSPDQPAIRNRTKVDLMIIAGTSLTVSPACNLVEMVADDTPRLLVNLEEVGHDVGMDFSGADTDTVSGSGCRDHFLQGTCDEGFLLLAKQVGWLGELAAYKEEMCPGSAALLESALKGEKER
jgi:NAD+-dependent protein deacetylase sirtuin 2